MEQVDEVIKRFSADVKARKLVLPSNYLQGQKRLTDEPFEDYRVRLKVEDEIVKFYRKGFYESV